MISSVLNLANAFLELLNTPFGQFATRVVLVTTALTGLQGVLKGYMAFMKGGAIVSTITKIFSVAGPGVGIVERFAVALGGINPVVAGVTAGIAALGLAIYGVKKYVDEVNKPLSDFNEEIDSINSQLQNNQTRLDEINAMPWNARTSEILEEKAALEKQNEELEKNLELLNQEKYERAQSKAENFIFNTGEQKTITKGGSTSRRMSTTFDVTIGGEAAYEEAARQLEEYRHQLEQTGQITDAQRKRFDEVNAAVAEQIEWLQVLVDRGDTLTESQQRMYDAYYALGNAYDVAVNGAQALINAYTELTSTGYITEATYQQLIALYPQLADGAVQTANGYQIQQDALLNLMSAEGAQLAQGAAIIQSMMDEAYQAGLTGDALYDYVYSLVTASNTNLSVEQQVSALKALADWADYAGLKLNALYDTSSKSSQIEYKARQYMKRGMSAAKAYEKAQAEVGGTGFTWNSPKYTPSSPIYTPSTNITKPSTSGTSGKPSSSTYNDSKRSEAQSQIKQLQAQQDVIQDKIDAVNEKYDAQLKELEDINDALEEQIQLQKLLQALTEAKASKKMVFKDGRFQYLSDVDAIAKAQSNLEEFYQEQELKKKKKRIEEERQIELEGLNAEKEYLQKRIKEWQNYLSAMGSYNSGGYFADSYDSLTAYVDAWNKKIGQIKPTPDYPDDGGGDGGSDIPSGPTPAQIAQNEKIAAKYQSGAYDDSKNSSFSKSTVKVLQKWYGTDADGIWGRNSYKAAGNRNIATAYALWMAVKNVYGTFAEFKRMGGYAQGTLSSKSGISMVGEQGPELRVLNKGDGIIPAKQTATLWSFANDPTRFLQNLNNIGGKTDIFNIANVSLPNVQNPQEFISGLRNLAYQRTYKPNFGTV